jgi:NADH-quinone oxidoreductase subunit C
MSQDAKPAPVMATEAWEDTLSSLLHSKFAIDKRESYRGQPFAVTTPEQFFDVVRWLRDEQRFDYLVDFTAVDYPKEEARFELVAILYSFADNRYLRIKTRIPDGYQAASLSSLYAGANWLEREIFDMFGIRFAGHPNLKRILLPEEWEGFPLRKDKSIVDMDQNWVRQNLGIESGQ